MLSLVEWLRHISISEKRRSTTCPTNWSGAEHPWAQWLKRQSLLKAKPTYKMSIALKEANETHYWLDLLHYGDYLEDDIYLSLDKDIRESISLLVAIVKKSKDNK